MIIHTRRKVTITIDYLQNTSVAIGYLRMTHPPINIRTNSNPTPCDVLSPEQLEQANLELNSRGISPDRKNEIDAALRKFNKNKTLPPNCSRTNFDAWVARNKPIHIGRSNRSEQVAERELGKWYVVWYTLFPDKEIPYHPCEWQRSSIRR